MQGYIYLIQEREFINKNVVKLGCTIQGANNKINRLLDYKKGSRIILVYNVQDADKTRDMERLCKECLKKRFKSHSDGHEHFIGNEEEIKHCIVDILARHERRNEPSPVHEIPQVEDVVGEVIQDFAKQIHDDWTWAKKNNENSGCRSSRLTYERLSDCMLKVGSPLLLTNIRDHPLVLEDPSREKIQDVAQILLKYNKTSSKEYDDFVTDCIRTTSDSKTTLVARRAWDHFQCWCRYNAPWFKASREEFIQQLTRRFGEEWQGKELVDGQNEICAKYKSDLPSTTVPRMEI